MLVKIFISSFEYLTLQTTSKTYYEYRRCIYIFRNSYLGYFLHFGVENIKLFFASFDNSQSIYAITNLTLELLESVFMYPFTLSLHEFEVEEDSVDNISGANSGDVYFPSYFRHVLCDVVFLDSILKYFQMLLQNNLPFDQKRKELTSGIKILGRASIPSQYTFKNEDEKLVARDFSIKFIQFISTEYRYHEFYYLNTIMDVFLKMLTMYDFFFSSNRGVIIDATLEFLGRVITEVEITIEEGKKNPFAKVFELLATCIDCLRDRGEQEEQLYALKVKSQRILEKAFERLIGPEADLIMNVMGYNSVN